MTSYPNPGLLIGGCERTATESLEVLNPATGLAIGKVAVSSSSDVADAIAAAEKGFAAWRAVAPDKRCEVLMAAAALLRQRADEIALVLTAEQGKPLAEAKAEVIRACDIIDWDAQEGRRVYGRVIPSASNVQLTVLREPIGVVAAFSPWNFPFGSPCRKISGALAAGCAIVLKPSEEAPASGLLLAKAFIDAGVPANAVNVVFGRPQQTAEQLIAHPSVRLVAFTGSVPVGRQIAEMAARHLKPALLELGGHAPAIICADADPEKVARAAVLAKSRSSGQICTMASRFFVHRLIYPQFVAAFKAAAEGLRLDDGTSANVDMGPLANERRVAAMEAMVRDAKEHGAQVVVGGHRPDRPGSFFPLTLLADVPAEALAMHEEPFGPLALTRPFDDLDEVIAAANSVPYGLGAYVFTESARTIAKLVAALECGNISVNHFGGTVPQTPLGGVKESGYGREGGTEGLTHYTVVKCVSTQL